MEKMQKRRFTLIEMLVVVAIITILAALLLPALRNAKEAGMRIECLGNTKQIGQVFMLYGEDYGYLPSINNTLGPNNYYYQDHLAQNNFVTKIIF